jgi:hypothetical protein
MPTINAVRSSWTERTISPAAALVPGASRRSTARLPATPRAQPSKPAPPATAIETERVDAVGRAAISGAICFTSARITDLARVVDYLGVIDRRPPGD